MVVLSLTVLLQVFVLSAFGLSAVKGQAAEAERDRREICRRVLSRNLVEELSRRVEEGVSAAQNPITALRTPSPLADPVFGRALRQATAAGHLVREAFLVLPDGSVFDAERFPVLLPAAPAVPAPAGDRASPFEAVERDADLGGEPAALALSTAAILERAGPEFRAAGLTLLARLERRAGRPEAAIDALSALCREFPATLDAREYPPAPVGLEAARARAALRLSLVREGKEKAASLVDDLLALRRVLLLCRDLVPKSRAAYEEAALQGPRGGEPGASRRDRAGAAHRGPRGGRRAGGAPRAPHEGRRRGPRRRRRGPARSAADREVPARRAARRPRGPGPRPR